MSTNVWDQIALSAARGGGMDTARAWLPIYQKGPLEYHRTRYYKSAFAFEASRKAIQLALNEINQLFPNLKKRLQKEARAVVEMQQDANYSKLIENQMVLTDQGFGKVSDPATGRTLFATDHYGTLLPEALMLYYEGEESLDAEQYFYKPITSKSSSVSYNAVTIPSFKTKLVLHIDRAPEIKIESSKNLVLTKVQGRDFTRKELVSGGDLTFSVSGSIQSDQSGVYPSLAVQKFIMNMQYGGILNVHHFMFKQLGVTRVLIQDWRLDTPECKNVQPYSFSCVAVEPDEEVVLQDTIQQLNEIITPAVDLNFWQKLILDDKFTQVATNMTNKILSGSISELAELTSGKI